MTFLCSIYLVKSTRVSISILTAPLNFFFPTLFQLDIVVSTSMFIYPGSYRKKLYISYIDCQGYYLGLVTSHLTDKKMVLSQYLH